jgi:hypothetical protein
MSTSVSRPSPAITIGSNRFAGLKTTPVYDSYWRFAAERQAIFFGRIAGSPPPWTDDPILRRHKFTNAYRVSDRVSQFLIREVIYNPAYDAYPREIVFRILLFKLFNKIETWQLLETELGTPRWSEFSAVRYDQVLSQAFGRSQRLYSSAYIIPPVRLGVTDGVKHRGHLSLLELMMRDDVPVRASEAKNLEAVYLLLKSYPSIGNFLGFQLAIDFNYSAVVDWPESDYVVAGPGARDGIAKCFENAKDFEAADIIALMADRQEAEFARLGLEFRSLWGRPLQLIDCQNLFCEISKYARVAHPEFAGVSGRTRIKQVFQPKSTRLRPWYPPKWGLNDKLVDLENLGNFDDDLFRAEGAT